MIKMPYACEARDPQSRLLQQQCSFGTYRLHDGTPLEATREIIRREIQVKYSAMARSRSRRRGVENERLHYQRVASGAGAHDARRGIDKFTDPVRAQTPETM